MENWTDDAAKAIEVCENWAKDVFANIDCQLYLFGSAIYKAGEQFDYFTSDLDIICLLPENINALARYKIIKALLSFKHNLELLMISELNRSTCDEPGVSIVTITKFELGANIHKSGARSFFDKNFFYDLKIKEVILSIPGVGTQIIAEDRRQAIELTQKIRNSYLSVSANRSGGLPEFNGSDPIPKSILRSAAQIAPDLNEGEWYDTRLGLELMHGLLSSRRPTDQIYSKIFNKFSVRRGGRGQKVPLSADDQLLLAEILFDEATRSPTENSLIWEIRAIGVNMTDENVKAVFSEISKLAPSATLIAHRAGSIILTIRSSASAFDIIQKLHELNVLNKILKFEFDTPSIAGEKSAGKEISFKSHVDYLLESIEKWIAKNAPFAIEKKLGTLRFPTQEFESNLGDFLKLELIENPNLQDGQIKNDTMLSSRERNFSIDFTIEWLSINSLVENIGIEIIYVNTKNSFFWKLQRLIEFNFPIIFVLVGEEKIIRGLANDIERLKSLNPNFLILTALSS